MKGNSTTYRSVDDNTKVVNKAFSVEEVVGSDEEVPGERAEPWQSMDAIHCVPDVDDLFKTLHLYYQCLPTKYLHYPLCLVSL